MWKRKKKQKEAEVVEETVDAVTEESSSSEGEQAVRVETEKASSAEEEKVGATAEEVPSIEEQKAVSATAKKAPPEKKEEKVEVEDKTGNTFAVEEVSSSGVFIFGSRVESRFKKFMTALFSIFLLPPVIVFGLSVITIVVLIAFPLISIVLPITLLSLCILFILLPVVLPLLTIVALITGKGKVQFGLENKKFAIKVLGITIPPYAGR